MVLREGEYDPAGPRSEYRSIVDAAAAYRAEHTVAFLTTGFDRLADREFCLACPAALLCAAAEGELNRLAPTTGHDAAPWRRRVAVQTLVGLSVTTVDHPDSEDICFGKVVRAIERGYLLEPAGTPSDIDALDPAAQQLLWLADRIREFTRDVAARLATGQFQ